MIFSVAKKNQHRWESKMEGLLNELHPATFRLFQQPFDYPGNFSIIQQLFDFRQRTSIVVEAQYPKLKVSLFNFDEKSPKSTKPTYAFFFSHEVVAKTGSYCAPITTVWRGRRFRNREAVLPVSYEIWFYLQKIECFPHQKIEFFPLRTCFFCYVFFPNFCLRTCLNAFFKLFSSIRGLLTKTEPQGNNNHRIQPKARVEYFQEPMVSPWRPFDGKGQFVIENFVRRCIAKFEFLWEKNI